MLRLEHLWVYTKGYCPSTVVIHDFKNLGYLVLYSILSNNCNILAILLQVHISEICKTPSVTQRWITKKGKAPSEVDIDRIYHKYQTTTEDVLANNSALITGKIISSSIFTPLHFITLILEVC